jgi:hypothetical protein
VVDVAFFREVIILAHYWEVGVLWGLEYRSQTGRYVMKIRDLLEKKGYEVVTIPPSFPIQDAMRLLVEHNIGSVVVAEDRAVQGIITERDILRLAAKDPGVMGNFKAEEVMTKDVIVGLPDDTLEYHPDDPGPGGCRGGTRPCCALPPMLDLLVPDLRESAKDGRFAAGRRRPDPGVFHENYRAGRAAHG